MIKKFISVTSPPPLSQTVTPFRTLFPSSVTYFMDDPFAYYNDFGLCFNLRQS